MAQHQDLDVLLIRGPEVQHDQFEGTTSQTVDEAKPHRRSLTAPGEQVQLRRKARSRPAIEYSAHTPSRWSCETLLHDIRSGTLRSADFN